MVCIPVLLQSRRDCPWCLSNLSPSSFIPTHWKQRSVSFRECPSKSERQLLWSRLLSRDELCCWHDYDCSNRSWVEWVLQWQRHRWTAVSNKNVVASWWVNSLVSISMMFGIKCMRLWDYWSIVYKWFVFGDMAFQISRYLCLFFENIWSYFQSCFLSSLYSPKLRDHFDSLGFDLSIIVTRWFIPLFSNNMSFSLLFRIWDYLFIVGISGMFRVTMALLLHYSNEILASDLIQLSSFIHDVGMTHLQKEKDVQSFFKTMISLRDVGTWMLHDK